MHNASIHYVGKSPPVAKSFSTPPQQRPAGLVIRRVTNSHERLASDLLVRRMYAWRGYRAEPLKSSLGNSDRITIAAWKGEDLAATLTLSRDNGTELLCETLYRDEIAALRAKKLRICEYSRLATDPEHSSPVLLMKLFRTAYLLSRSHFDASDVVVEVNPRHSRYYQREWGFARIGPMRICPRVEAPAILLHRNLHHAIPEYCADVKAA